MGWRFLSPFDFSRILQLVLAFHSLPGPIVFKITHALKNKMVEEQVYMEYISLHGYIRNTPSDTEVHSEHQLRADRSTSPVGKEYIESCKTLQDKGTRGKNKSVSRTGPALSGQGNLNMGTSPTSGQLSESEEKHLRLRVKQLICGSLNRMRIRQSLPQPYIPQTGTLVPWKTQQLGAAVQLLQLNWSLWDCGAIPE